MNATLRRRVISQTPTNSLAREPSVYNHETGLAFDIREYKAEDDGVVIGPWLSQIRKVEPFRSMSREEFSAHKRDTIEPLVARCPPYIACAYGAPDQVLGWACGEVLESGRQALYFAYTKQIFRRHGICNYLLRLLFPEFGKQALYYAYKTRGMKGKEKAWRASYNPYLI